MTQGSKHTWRVVTTLMVITASIALSGCDNKASESVVVKHAQAKREEGKKAIMTNKADPFGGFK